MLKLTVANYATWKTKIEMLQIQEGLWLIVSQRHLRPTVTTSHSTGSASSSCTRCSAAGPINDDEEVRKWDEDAEQATATISSTLTNVQNAMSTISATQLTYGMLRNIYKGKSFSARFYHWQKFFTLQFTDFWKHEKYVMVLYLDTY
jgi:hypothetical protein